MKNCKVDLLLITGVMSPYAGVVEKMFKDLNKEKVTLLKVERAGDVLADAVSYIHDLGMFCTLKLYSTFSPPRWPSQFCSSARAKVC